MKWTAAKAIPLGVGHGIVPVRCGIGCLVWIFVIGWGNPLSPGGVSLPVLLGQGLPCRNMNDARRRQATPGDAGLPWANYHRCLLPSTLTINQHTNEPGLPFVSWVVAGTPGRMVFMGGIIFQAPSVEACGADHCSSSPH